MKKIGIIDYEAGNILSVVRAFEYVIAREELREKVEVVILNKPEDYQMADAIVCPGQGSAGQIMSYLERSKTLEVLKEKLEVGVPYLGICLGMQILFDYSEEQDTKCLGLVSGEVRKFKSENLKVPQIGWNQVQSSKNGDRGILFGSINDSEYFYFAHSFFVEVEDEDLVAATSNYGTSFPSAIRSRTLFGVQFHPEKSGEVGLRLIGNFVRKLLSNVGDKGLQPLVRSG